MGMIFDSCIWVALAANQLDRQAAIEAARDAPVFTSVISLGELSFGVHSCADAAERAMRRAQARCCMARMPRSSALLDAPVRAVAMDTEGTV